MELRDYQAELRRGADNAWADGYRSVLLTAPTGSGKTVIFSSVLTDHPGASCAVAHRQELVSQISLSLGDWGLSHRVLAQRKTVRWIIALHYDRFGRSFVNPESPCAVAGVDTLIRMPRSDPWHKQVSLWVMDEAHHVLRANKWGKAVALFPNARGLGVTATPGRADGRGLGLHADGYFEALVEGPTTRDLINRNYLADYRYFEPASDLDLSHVAVSKATGDFVPGQLSAAVKKSHLTGDIVEHYLRIARGKLGITFVDSVETAHEVAERFNAAGIPAAAVSAKTDDRLRLELVAKFRAGQLLQLVNVDLFGEGFDLPEIFSVSMARATQSLNLYIQQAGRCMRPGKPFGAIIDHVGNRVRHGLPDQPRVWSLNRRDRKKQTDPDKLALRVCLECTQPYPRHLRVCPYCGAIVTYARRDGPEYVDGDLIELDAETLARLRGEVDRIDEDPQNLWNRMSFAGAPPAAIGGAVKQHRKRQHMQRLLRDTIALWAGIRRDREGDDDGTIYRKFYAQFGIDMMSAQALGRPESQTLACRILGDMTG